MCKNDLELGKLSPSIRECNDVFTHSGLSAEYAIVLDW